MAGGGPGALSRAAAFGQGIIGPFQHPATTSMPDPSPLGRTIDGVPFCIFNRRIGVSGAQEPATLLAAMDEALNTSAD